MKSRLTLAIVALAGAVPTALAENGDLRVLLTNDDGWRKPLLTTVYDALRSLKIGGRKINRILSAPEKPQSGKATVACVPSNRKWDNECGTDKKDPALHSVNSSPVTAAWYGLIRFGKQKWGTTQASLVLSGINVGTNTGSELLTSGTYNNAIFASRRQIPAVALSAVVWDNGEYHIYATLTSKLVPQILQSNKPWPKGVWLSVNFPEVHESCSEPDDFRWALSRVDMNNVPDYDKGPIFVKGADGRDNYNCDVEEIWNLPIEQEILRKGANPCLILVSINDNHTRVRVYICFLPRKMDIDSKLTQAAQLGVQ